jgi:hypothetical protein
MCGQERTALHSCANLGTDDETSLLAAALLLVHSGANVNAPDEDVNCPLKCRLLRAAQRARGFRRWLAPTRSPILPGASPIPASLATRPLYDFASALPITVWSCC